MMVRDMRIILLVTAAVMLLGVLPANVKAIEPTVVDFDDLDYDTTLSGTNYAGLTWEWGNDRGDGHLGEWYIPSDGYDSYPYSPPHVVINGWGASLMGIGFSEPINVLGAYFAGIEGGPTAPGVRVHGYLDSVEVAITDWFNDIDTTPSWFAMNLNNVDRIVVEAILVERQGLPDAGWYQMDNLTYVPEPGTILLLGLGGLILRKRRKA